MHAGNRSPRITEAYNKYGETDVQKTHNSFQNPEYHPGDSECHNLKHAEGQTRTSN